MTRFKLSITLAAGLLAFTGTAQAQGISGSVGIWGQWVEPTNGVDDSSRCSGSGTEFCAGVQGYGGLAEIFVPTGGSYAFFADFRGDYHEETNKNVSSRQDHLTYYGLGLHLINQSNPAMPYGAFLVGAQADPNADSSKPVQYLGGGLELGLQSGSNQYAFQLGGLTFHKATGSGSIDALNDMIFARAEMHRPMWNGTFSGGLALGFGDFDEGSNDDRGTWAQLSAMYEAPIGSGPLSWFAGYQGDFVKVCSTSGCSVNNGLEQAFFHTAFAGLRIRFGGAQQSPFTTPNFRAPLGNAPEMN